MNKVSECHHPQYCSYTFVTVSGFAVFVQNTVPTASLVSDVAGGGVKNMLIVQVVLS